MPETRLSGISLRTLRKYENGAEPMTKQFLNFGHAFDVSLDYLACGDTRWLQSHLTKFTPGKVAILKRYRRLTPAEQLA
jgi:hypothetical protein